GTWSGTLKIKLGPVSSTYRGSVRLVRTDEAAHTAELSAEGRDTRGKGGADMTMRSALTRLDAGTEVHVASTVHVTGVLARMGRGMVEDVSDQLFGTFTACVREKLERIEDGGGAVPEVLPGEAPPPDRGEQADALQLGGVGAQAVGRALVRLVRRPAFWGAVVVVGVVVWLVLRG
ncbi:MAG TPA: SRPBCC domain-containing protein, partial [Longimicrobiales bacterium]|nr:SRPBCC domain-containing protein [Longimicrobiales bacterium]